MKSWCCKDSHGECRTVTVTITVEIFDYDRLTLEHYLFMFISAGMHVHFITFLSEVRVADAVNVCFIDVQNYLYFNYFKVFFYKSDVTFMIGNQHDVP